MSNKLSKKQLDLLIERVLNEKFSDFFPERTGLNKTTNPNKYNKGIGDGRITTFLKNYNLKDNKKNRELVAKMYNNDGDPTTLSEPDLRDAMNNDRYAIIAKSMAKTIYSKKNPDSVLIDFFDEWFKKQRIGFDGNEIYIEPEFIFPDWVKFLGANKDVVKKAAEEEDPAEIFSNDDVVKIIEDNQNPLHYWMLDFLEKSLVLAQQSKFETSTNNFILNNFPELINKSKRIDPEDKSLGRGKALPNIPITGRYGTRTGGETPETLARIFENAKVLQGTSVARKMKSINSFMAKINKSNTANLSIEEISSNLIVVDYLKRIVQDYEASAGGFLFENFLALLLSGTKEGGNLKIEDFTYVKAGEVRPILGSAKLYRMDANKYSGSKKLFYNAGLRTTLATRTGVRIEYVLARKGYDLEKVEIFTDVIYAKKQKDADLVDLFNKKTKIATLGPSDRGQIEFDWPSTAVATVNFLAMKLEDTKYQDVVKEAMNSTKEKLGNLNITINNLSTSVTKFFSILKSDKTNKSSSWQQTMEDIKDFRLAAFETFINVDETDDPSKKATVTGATKGKLTENKKKSKKDLDKLIEAVILETLRKK